MKSSKILLLLTSMALLASCGGTSSSASTSQGTSEPAKSTIDSSVETTSVDSTPTATSEPEPEKTSEISSEESSEESFVPVDPTTGKNKLSAAFKQSIDNDAIALDAILSANGQFDGTVGGGNQSNTVNTGHIDLNGGYMLSAAVSGLKATDPNDVKGAARLVGSHELNVTDTNGLNYQSKLETDSAAYLKNNRVYFNFDEPFADFMAETTGYPYGAGKIYFDFFLGEGLPLLTDSFILQALESFDQVIATGERFFPSSITYSQTSENFKAELKLDHNAVIYALDLLGDNIPYWVKMASKVDFKSCDLTILTNAEGIENIILNIDASLHTTYGELMPEEGAIPPGWENEPLDADLSAFIGFAFTYGEDFEFPADLDTYEEGQTSNQHPRDFLSIDQVADIIRQIDDPEYTALEVYKIDSSGKSAQHTASHHSTDGDSWQRLLDDPTFHLSQETLQVVKDADPSTINEFYFEGDCLYYHLFFEQNVEGQIISLDMLSAYPASNAYQYASKRVITTRIGDTYATEHFELFWDFDE